MAIEGYIDLAQIGHGVHKLVLNDLPHFMATAPVALIPIFAREFGPFTNMTTSDGDLDHLIEFAVPPIMTLYDFPYEPDRRRPMFAIAIVDIDCLEKMRWFADTWIGGIDHVANKANWDKIAPGVWALERYHTTDQDGEFVEFKFSPDVEVRARLSMRLWTSRPDAT